MLDIKIKIEESAQVPTYATEGSVGMDLVAHNFHKVYKGSKEVPLSQKMLHSIARGFLFLRPHERVVVDTGIQSIELPEGYHMEIRSRSGLAVTRGLIVANQPGTIDSDYRGSVKVVLLNTTPYLSKIVLGMRVAQAVIMPYVKANLIPVEEELSETKRGKGGFGSTGV